MVAPAKNLEFQPSHVFERREKMVPGLQAEFERVFGEHPERAGVVAEPLESLEVEVDRKKYTNALSDWENTKTFKYTV